MRLPGEMGTWGGMGDRGLDRALPWTYLQPLSLSLSHFSSTLSPPPSSFPLLSASSDSLPLLNVSPLLRRPLLVLFVLFCCSVGVLSKLSLLLVCQLIRVGLDSPSELLTPCTEMRAKPAAPMLPL